MERVPATIVAVEKQRVLHNLNVFTCSVSYPACKVHAPYCHQLLAPLYNIFHITSHTAPRLRIFTPRMETTNWHEMVVDDLGFRV